MFKLNTDKQPKINRNPCNAVKYTAFNVCAGSSVPQAIEDMAVGVNSQHDIVCGRVMDEGSLGMDKEHVWHPNLLH